MPRIPHCLLPPLPAAGLAAVVLLLSLGVQVAWAVHTPGIYRPTVSRTLSLLGFAEADTPGELALAVLPLLLALVTSALQVQSSRGADAAARRRQEEGVELQPMASRRRRSAPVLLVSTYSNTGVAAGAALAVAALARPALLALPFDLALAAAVWRWASGSGGSSSGGGLRARGMQRYTGLCLLLLYVWQAALHYLPWLSPAAALLGLYAPAADQPWAELAPELVQLAALVVLYITLGFLGAQQWGGSSGSGRAGTSSGGAGSWSVPEEGEQQQHEGGRALTLLAWILNISEIESEQQHQLQQQQQQRRRQSHGVAASGWPGQGGAGAAAEEGVPLLAAPPTPMRRHQPVQRPGPDQEPTSPLAPHVQAPTLLGAAAPGAARLRRVLLPLACEAVAAATEQLCSRPSAVAAALALNALLRPSMLGGLLLVVALAALLAPKACGAGMLVSSAQPLAALLLLWQLACYSATAVDALLPAGDTAAAVGLHDFADAGPLAWAPLLAMLAAAAAAAGLARSRSSEPAAGAAAVTTGLGAAPGSSAGSAWALVRQATLRLLWYAGFAAVPAVQFVVGASQYTVLHGAYLAGLLLAQLGRTLQLRPRLKEVSGVRHSPQLLLLPPVAFPLLLCCTSQCAANSAACVRQPPGCSV